jgi:hypothetical protein
MGRYWLDYDYASWWILGFWSLISVSIFHCLLSLMWFFSIYRFRFLQQLICV